VTLSKRVSRGHQGGTFNRREPYYSGVPNHSPRRRGVQPSDVRTGAAEERRHVLFNEAAPMTVYLVPIARRRHELYTEHHDDGPGGVREGGRVQRWMDTASIRWRELVEQARQQRAQGTLGRWRDAVVCRLAESIAEQRTLWGLRSCSTACLVHSSSFTAARARVEMAGIAAVARRHHLRWLVIDTFLFVASGLLAIVPGPNLLAYYFLFRLIGHLQSWRGARQADRITWTFEGNDSLAELETLVDVPRAERASRVEAIAERLNIPRLSAFFERTAVPSS